MSSALHHHLLFLGRYFFFEVAVLGNIIQVVQPSLSGIVANHSFIRAWGSSHPHTVKNSSVLTKDAYTSDLHPHAIERTSQLQSFTIFIGDRDAGSEPQDLSLDGGTRGAFADIGIIDNDGWC